MSQLTAPAHTIRRSGTARAKRPVSTVRAPRTGESSTQMVTRRAAAPRGNTRFFGLLAALVFASMMALLLLNTARAEQSFTISRLSADVTTLQNRQEAVSSDLDAVSASEELATRAEKMGMTKASVTEYRDKATGKVLGRITSQSAGGAISVNTLPNTPASNAAESLLQAGNVGLHVTDPVAKAQAAAEAKAKADAKKKDAQAPAK